MSADGEWNRLQALYAAMADGELTKLYLERESLTETANEALTKEFHARGLTVDEEPESPVPGLEIDGPYVALWEFLDDPNGAKDALVLLRCYDVEADMKPEETDFKRPDSSVVFTWKLFVAKTDKTRAIELLRKHKGLFPIVEANDLDVSYLPDESDTFVVGEFDDPADAALAESGLRAANIAFRQRSEEHDGKTLAVFEVAQNDIDRAAEAMANAFAVDTMLNDEV